MSEEHRCRHVWDGGYRDTTARCMWPICRDAQTATCTYPDYKYPGSEAERLRASLAAANAENERLKAVIAKCQGPLNWLCSDDPEIRKFVGSIVCDAARAAREAAKLT